MTARFCSLRSVAPTLILLVVVSAGCGSESPLPVAPRTAAGVTAPATPATPPPAALSQALRVQSTYGDALLDLVGVEGDGVGIGSDGQPCVKVFVSLSGVQLPALLGGVRVEQEASPAFRAFSLIGRYRPLAIGVSTGNANECIPGTIGCVLARGSRRFLLSCNHVFARENLASIGETIVQPSRPDGTPDCSPNPPADAVATLSDYQPLDFANGDNFYDAAIAEITLAPGNITCATPPGYYGAPGATPVTGVMGLGVMKVGRTTELTRGSIKAVDVKIKVTYPLGVAKFSGVMLTSKDFGAFGDSGSLVVTDDSRRAPVGLLFSGDALGRGLICPIAPILARFSATICTN